MKREDVLRKMQKFYQEILKLDPHNEKAIKIIRVIEEELENIKCRRITKKIQVEEQLKKVLESLIKEKIVDAEKEFTFEKFTYCLFKDTNKLKIKKLNEILNKIEFVNNSLKEQRKKIKEKSRKKNLEKEFVEKIKKFNEKMAPFIKKKTQSNLINKNYIEHLMESIEKLKDYVKHINSNYHINLFDFNSPEELNKYLRKNGMGMVFLNKNLIGYQEKIFGICRDIFGKYIKLNKHIKDIIKYLKEVYQWFLLQEPQQN